MNQAYISRRLPGPQRGVALATGMLMLLMLTVLGVASFSTITLEEQMAGNLRDQDLAFQAAESALRDAEAQVAGLVYACGHGDVDPGATSFSATSGTGQTFTIWARGAAGLPDPWDDASWANATPYSQALSDVAAQPRYTIEEYSFDPNTNSAIYRITARGEGGTANARRVVQSYYRRYFDQVVQITGTNGPDVVAVGESILAVQLSVGGTVDVDISLGGWDPEACAGTGDSRAMTLYFRGNGGLDTFVVANLADVGYAPVSNPLMQDVTSGVTGLAEALTEFNINRVMVENPGSTATVIANTNLLTDFSEDNSYCLNTASGDAGQSLLSGLLGDFLPLLLNLPALGPVLDIVDSVSGSLIGPGGLLPLLPASASIVVDVSGNDRYEVYTDTTTSAVVLADVTGDDFYRVQAVGAGLINLPVILDTQGDDVFEVSGGSYLRIELDLDVLETVTDLLDDPLVTDLLEQLSPVVSLLVDGCDGLLGGITCSVLSPLADLLNGILDTVGGLFGGTPQATVGVPTTFQAGLCAPPTGQRLSWREVRR